jgi:hypothetical protein
LGVTVTTESSLSRLLTLFKTSRVAILSAEISRDTIERMADREDFFKKFSEMVGRHVGPVLRSQISDREIALYNARAMKHLRSTKLPFISLRGAFSYDGVNTSLEHSIAFVGVSNSNAVELASTYFQQAYIYVQKGIFYYFDSKDNQHYYPAATLKWDEVFPGRVKARDPLKPETDNLHPIPKNGTMKAGTLIKNKSFVIDFDFDQGADPALVQAIESLNEELGHQIFVNAHGHIPFDQAKIEIQLLIEKMRLDAEHDNFKELASDAVQLQAYAQALSAVAV